jgi:hypothetical protein
VVSPPALAAVNEVEAMALALLASRGTATANPPRDATGELVNRRWIGLGWTLALLALLGHVAGADCCLIRGAVRETLERATATVVATPEAHACCAATSAAAAAAPADAARGEAPLPECCGVNCAPIATIEASFALSAPAISSAAVTPEAAAVPGVASLVTLAFAHVRSGSPPEPGTRAERGRAPPIA